MQGGVSREVSAGLSGAMKPTVKAYSQSWRCQIHPPLSGRMDLLFKTFPGLQIIGVQATVG